MSAVSPELQQQVEQWYYREARLLDGRQYQQWLALVHPEIHYVMPARTNPLVDNARRGHEDMISVERELDGVDSDGCPIRNETFPYLAMRVERAYKANSWSENPAPRTRRLVGNVEIARVEGERHSVLSSFHLHYARPSAPVFFYAGQRRDLLLRADDDFRLLEREVVMDLAEIDLPTLGLFL